jgi:outer membrane protein with beta-barrel domain
VACLLLAAASSAFAQQVSVGIKAGVPLTGLLRSNQVAAPCCREGSTQTKRYTIGPVVDIRLPLGFGVEFGALYKRFDQQSYTLTTTGFTTDDETSYPIQETAGISAVGHSWEFPVAVQYRFFKSEIRPYVEGGVSLNRLSNVYSLRNVSINFRQLPFTFAPRRGSFTRVGPLFGMGVDVKLHRIHVTPGLRYTHYNRLSALPTCSGPDCGGSKAVDFLVGVTFELPTGRLTR